MKTKLNPLHLDQQLCFALYSASRLMIQGYDEFLQELEVTYPQYLVLLVLWEDDRQTVTSLGRRLSLDSGTLSPLLKILEKKGLIKKARDSEDQRIVLVSMSAKGKALEKKAAKIPTSMFCKLDMKEKEFQNLRQQLIDLSLRLHGLESA